VDLAFSGGTEVHASGKQVVKRRRRFTLVVLVAVIAALWGLWQIDLVRQNAEILYLSFTGNRWELRGSQKAIQIPSKTLGETRQAILYLPPGYDSPENRTRRYPVLYLLHGFPNPGGYASWVRYGRAPQEVDRLIVEKHLAPLLVVCPDGQGTVGKFGDSEYLDPITPGNGSKIATFITQDLVDFIDNHYRTIPRSEARILGGASTGGYGAANLGLQHPEVWKNILSFSGYFEADPAHFGAPLWGESPHSADLRAQSPLSLIQEAPNSKRWQDVFVFLGEGADEPAKERETAVNFAMALQQAGVTVVHQTPPGSHSWDVWRELLRSGLIDLQKRLPQDK
jgi:enterochelin esterase-like enzyme